jgi:hypothetical protein
MPFLKFFCATAIARSGRKIRMRLVASAYSHMFNQIFQMVGINPYNPDRALPIGRVIRLLVGLVLVAHVVPAYA